MVCGKEISCYLLKDHLLSGVESFKGRMLSDSKISPMQSHQVARAHFWLDLIWFSRIRFRSKPPVIAQNKILLSQRNNEALIF